MAFDPNKLAATRERLGVPGEVAKPRVPEEKEEKFSSEKLGTFQQRLAQGHADVTQSKGRDLDSDLALAQYGGGQDVGGGVPRDAIEQQELEGKQNFLRSLAGAAPELTMGQSFASAAKNMGIMKRAPLVGLGFAGGDAMKQLGEQFELLTGIDLPILRGEDAPRTSGEALKRILTAGGAGTAGEGVASAVGFALSPTKRFFGNVLKKGMVTEGAKSIDDVLKVYGQNLSNSQSTMSTTLDIADNIAKNSPTTSGSFRLFLRDIETAGQNYADDVVKYIDSPEQIQAAFVNSFTRRSDTVKGFSNSLYHGMDTTIDLALGTKGARTVGAKTVRAQAEKSPAVLNSYNSIMKRLGLNKGINELTFSEARQLKTGLVTELVEAEGAKTLLRSEAAALAATTKEIDKVLEATAKKHGLTEELKMATKVARTWEETFNDTFIKALVKKDAVAIGNKLTTIKKAGDIARIKRTVDKETWKQVQAAYGAAIINKGGQVTNELREFGGAQIRGRAIKQTLLEKNTPLAVQQAILGKEGVKELNEFADLLFAIQERSANSIGSMATQMLTSRGALELAGAAVAIGGTVLASAKGNNIGVAGSVAGGAAIFLLPVAMAKMVKSPAGRKILLEGATTVAGSAEAAKVIVRTLAFFGLDAAGNTMTGVTKKRDKRRKASESGRVPGPELTNRISSGFKQRKVSP